ncbi:integrase [Candidatus Gastranaerophilus sp. (ex Termes propinquus)]|nr:integrase [Candidatus Gastranaerophilus sp. (ex Termes propinquus)]
MANIQPRKDKSGKVISYSIRVHKGRDAEGKQLKPYSLTWVVPEGWSERKIQTELKRQVVGFEKQCKEGVAADNKQTFERYANYVLDLKKRNGIKHLTVVNYTKLLERIIPAIGHFKLADLRPQHLNSFYEQLSKDGMNKNTGGKLSPKMVLEHHRLVKAILAQAEKEMLVNYNAASKATPPTVKRKDVNCIDIDDFHNILHYLENEPLKKQVMMQLLMFTGCRRGEIVGLKWDKIDFNNNQIEISKHLLYSVEQGVYEDDLKTETSRRVIKIPVGLIELLRAHKKEQTLLRLACGTAWNNTGYVLTQENGEPMHPCTPTGYCKDFVEKYNKIIERENVQKLPSEQVKLLPKINPHAFRHSQASILIFSGVNVVTVSKRLGHAKVSTTADIYTHILQKADEASSDKLADIFFRNKATANS